MKLLRFPKKVHEDGTRGNALVTAVIVVSIMSMFGSLITSRMILNANSSAKQLVGNRAYYLAESGIEWALKYMKNGSTANITLGPYSIGGGTVTVVFRQTTIDYSSALTNTDVYQITSTATIGGTTRVIEELRSRGGANDKHFYYYREVVDSEDF
jgi:hypothetical protein